MMSVFDRTQIRRQRQRAHACDKQGRFFLHDWAASQILDRLTFVKRDFETTLQIGNRANDITPPASLFFKTGTNAAQNTSAVCDEDFLPFAPHILDLVVSALELHMVDDLPGCLLQIKQALKPDGLFLAAMLGGETLFELRDCLMQAETEISGGIHPRVFPFADKPQMGGLMQRAGFSLPVVDSDIVTVTYENMFALMHDLRHMGEGNGLSARKKSFTPKSVFMRAAALYAQKYGEPDGRIRASFEVIFLTGWSPHQSQQQPLKPGSATTRLSDHLQTQEHNVEQ